MLASQNGMDFGMKNLYDQDSRNKQDQGNNEPDLQRLCIPEDNRHAEVNEEKGL